MILSSCSKPDSSLVSTVSSQSQPGTQDGRKPEVPVVPFGMDLYYWDNPKDVEPMTLAPYVTHNNNIIAFLQLFRLFFLKCICSG